MKISLNRSSDVSLRQQLAEQIVFLITTGELKTGQRLPSVRTLARLVQVHHNTVSEAYQDLARRGWLQGKRGSGLIVKLNVDAAQDSPANLDELINETIHRAKEMGFSQRQLTESVRRRLSLQPPDHVLVVEADQGLREILCREVQKKLKVPVRSCSPEKLMADASVTLTAQVIAPGYLLAELKHILPKMHPAVSITYSAAEQQIDVIRTLKNPSIIAVVSVSGSFLKTARSLLAPVVGDRHTLQEVLFREDQHLDLLGVDLAFCDSLALDAVNCRRKVHYRLIATKCFEDLATTLAPSQSES
jgi:DNA-binding transcriptional regulator YhcF (GntR family)